MDNSDTPMNMASLNISAIVEGLVRLKNRTLITGLEEFNDLFQYATFSQIVDKGQEYWIISITLPDRGVIQMHLGPDVDTMITSPYILVKAFIQDSLLKFEERPGSKRSRFICHFGSINGLQLDAYAGDEEQKFHACTQIVYDLLKVIGKIWRKHGSKSIHVAREKMDQFNPVTYNDHLDEMAYNLIHKYHLSE